MALTDEPTIDHPINIARGFSAVEQDRPFAGVPPDRGRRMPFNDSWIAATAIGREIPVVTRGADYDDIPGLATIRV